MGSRVFIISIKPKFAYRIFSGIKRFELRKWIGVKPEKNSLIIVYVSGSVKAIIGEFKVGRVIIDKPSNLKNILNSIENTGVGPEDYSYIEKTKYALAIEVIEPRLYVKPIKLEHLKKILPDFEPPIGIREIDCSEPLYELIIRKAREETLRNN